MKTPGSVIPPECKAASTSFFLKEEIESNLFLKDPGNKSHALFSLTDPWVESSTEADYFSL